MTKISSSYRPDIDGLRGIAVFCVVVFHAGLTGFSGGFVGVDIFFVISGYLICTIIQREIEDGRFSYARFYARRAKRILPALFVMLLATFVLATLVMTSAEMKDFSKSAVANIGAFSNIYFWKSASYFSTSAELKPLLMTWSLSVEEQFYLFFPPVLLLLHRLKLRPGSTLAVLSAVSLAASIWMTPRYPTHAFFLLPARAWELGVGALLAQLGRSASMDRFVLPNRLREILAAGGLLALVYAITCYDAATRFPGIAAAVPVFGTAMLIATQGSIVNRWILGNKVLVFIGLVSYSWYLWHWPMMSFARIVAYHPITLTTSLLLAAVSFLVAILSWRFVEQPFRATPHSDSKTLWRYGAAASAMLAISTGLVAGRGWEGRLPENFVAIERSGAMNPNPCLAGYGQSAPNLGSACIAAAAGMTVALIGDSHAGALGPGLRALATRHGVGYTELTKSSCPALAGVTRLMPAHPQHARECAAFNHDVLSRLRDDASIKVVFIAGYWSAPFADEAAGQRFVPADRPSVSVTPDQSRRYLQQGLAATVEYLSAAGKKVVVLKDVPIFNFDPVRAVAVERIPMRKWVGAALDVLPVGDHLSAAENEVTNKSDLASRYIDAIARQYPQITVIDPAITLCAGSRCNYNGKGSLYYIDSQHLSEAGASVVLEQAVTVQLLTNPRIAAKVSAGRAM